MGLFTKKEDTGLLPNLPDLPNHETVVLPDHDPDEESYLPGITTKSYPVLSKEMNEEEVNNGLDDTTTFNTRNHYEFKKSNTFVPEPPEMMSPMKTQMISSQQKNPFKGNQSRMVEQQQRIKQNQPIFIRLDKFQTTHESLQDIRMKMEEVEKTIIKIKEVKEREDKEIEEWERELQLVKARLESIDTNLFENLS